jgi:hypothetical protein
MAQKYKVTMEDGNVFRVTLDKPPRDMADLRTQAHEMIRAGKAESVGPVQEVAEKVGSTPLYQGQPNEPVPTVGQAAGVVMPQILPTLGAIGGALTGPAAPLAMPAGSAAGEGINQLLGITEPSAENVALAGAVPAAGQIATNALSKGLKATVLRSPAASGAIHELAGQQVERIPARIPIIPEVDLSKLRQTFPQIGPNVTKDELYNLVNQFDPQIPMPNLRAAYDSLLSTEQKAVANLKVGKVMETGKQLVQRQDNQGAMPFQDVRVNASRIGALKRQAQESGNSTESGMYSQLWKAMQKDLEAAGAAGNPDMPAVQALKAANTAAKREFAIDDLADIVSVKGGGITPRPDLQATPGGAEQVQVNMNRIYKKVLESDDIKNALGKEEFAELTSDLARMAKVMRALPSPAGQNVGSFQRVKSLERGIALAGGAGGAAGLGLIDPSTAAMLGGVGMAANYMGPKVLATLIATKPGRMLLERTLTHSGGNLSSNVIGILGTAVGLGPTGREVGGAGMEMGRGVGQGAVELGRDLLGGNQ